MGSNYINEDAVISLNNNCIHDSNIGYEADFTVNGEHDDWVYYDGIHTFGVWDNFIFGTLYTTYGVIGRNVIFTPVDAAYFYTLKIVMKYNPSERGVTQSLPSQGKIAWRTSQDTIWNSDKEKTFTIYPDNKWHTYSINMATEQYWQGDVNDLRIYPAIDGMDGDEFFIRVIELRSIETYQCNNKDCDKYTLYSHSCPWVGSNGYCESGAHDLNSIFNIEEGSELIVNINEYGNEIIRIPEVINGSGYELAGKLTRAISEVDIGGYAEVQVLYSDNKFKIISGTRNTDSTVEIVDNDLARYLKFFGSSGNDVSTKESGTLPATGYSPFSSFRAKGFQIYSLLDSNEDTGVIFNPFIYSIEGGRRDWKSSGMGLASKRRDQTGANSSTIVVKDYAKVNNAGKTIIDFNHPFNASGRIKKIYAACSLDNWDDYLISKQETSRISTELSDARVMIFRPKKDGTLDVVEEIEIPDRSRDGDRIYSVLQETVSLDVDIMVNKGDLIGLYNINVYIGKTFSGNEVDAEYYQVSGKPTENFDPGKLNGDGSSGLLVYAHSEEKQKRFAFDIDLQRRYNIENVEIKGIAENQYVEYNYARCLDINWELDTFGLYHETVHESISTPYTYRYFRPNTGFGIECLSDGIYDVPDGIAMDDYYITYDFAGILNVIPEAGPGIVPTNPRYFWVNGDEEWLGIWLHAQNFMTEQEVVNFVNDPLALYIHFPYNKEKNIYKSRIYFKEPYNFRSFALSTYLGPYDVTGNADTYNYQLIPEYTSITLDDKYYTLEDAEDEGIDVYIFQNPCNGGIDTESDGDTIYEWDPIMSDALRDFGGGSGWYIYERVNVTNPDEARAARITDWNIITHEWEPITCKGFRIYTDYHGSTKICEFEIYGTTEDLGSSLPGGVDLSYSDYNDVIWNTEPEEIEDGLVEVFVGDTPRYLYFNLNPVTEVKYTDININVKNDDLYIGEKGCEYIHYLAHSRSGATNAPMVLNIENIYDRPYDLYVDISSESLTEDGLIFYSKLDSDESIRNPIIGPDAFYKKEYDYPLLNDDYNCAINCDCFGLNNLIDGKSAYYLQNNVLEWQEFGVLSHGTSVDFGNISDISVTELNLPATYRNRYWKFEFTCPDLIMNVHEIRTYCGEDKIVPVNTMYENRSNPEVGPMTDAPHLYNNSITGSYYRIYQDERIGVDLGGSIQIDRVSFFHDTLPDYSRDSIDPTTRFYIKQAEAVGASEVKDYSYYENEITKVGTGTILGENGNFNFSDSIEATITLSGTQCSDWMYDTGIYDTSFTCASGTVSGIGYWDISFNCDVDITNDNIDFNGLWYYLDRTGPYEDDYNFIFLDQVEDLDLKVHVNFSAFATGADYGLGLGLVDARAAWNDLGNAGDYFIGVQIVFNKQNDQVGIAANWTDSYTSYRGVCDNDGEFSYASLTLTTGVDYYCNLVYEGTNSFRLKVWTDAFDGSALVAETTLTISIPSDSHIRFQRFGVFSPLAGNSDVPNFDFKLYEVEISYTLIQNKEVLGLKPIYIDGNNDTYLECSYAYGMSVKSMFTSLDLYFMLDELPADGEAFYLVENWFPQNDWRAFILGDRLPKDTWAAERNVSFNLQEGALNIDFNTKLATHKWYHLAFSKGFYEAPNPSYSWRVYLNGQAFSGGGGSIDPDALHIQQNLRIGRNFKGWISNVRFNAAPYSGGAKAISVNSFQVPIEPYQKLFATNVYVSDDDLIYGKYVETDLWAETTGVYYNENNKFSSTYSTFFAIDLGHRYDIDFVRSYGVVDKLDFNETKNVVYSDSDTSDPEELDIEYIYSVDDTFTGDNFSKPDSNSWQSSSNSVYIYNNKLRLDLSRGPRNEAELRPNYFLLGDFDVRVDYSLIDTENTTLWRTVLEAVVKDGLEDSLGYRVSRTYTGTASRYEVTEYDYVAESSSTKIYKTTSDTSGKFRIVRKADLISFYIWTSSMWELLYQIVDAEVDDVEMRLYFYSGANDMIVAFDNYTTQIGTPIRRVASEDVRWLIIKLLSGDGTDRIIRKIGAYPDLTNYIAPGGGNYNHEWTSLGPAITAYSTGDNVALGATISGSSYIAGLKWEHLIDGIVNEDFYKTWGSDEEDEPWVLIDLGEEKSIYRFKIYTGYSPDDIQYQITDYQIQTSTDGNSFTTQFTISDNALYERVHDLASPITARYVRFYITGYDSMYQVIRDPETGAYLYFRGAMMRQIEIYEYYGYPSISSEEYPVIAINLKERFFIRDHQLVGLYAESSDTDWDNSDSNFAYSNSVLSEPKKISFTEFGAEPDFEQWVVIKRNTATNLNSGPDYLKHALIESENKCNFCNFSWWWSSSISTISNSYSIPAELAVRPLVIDYPASSTLDDIYLREGTDFGSDNLMAYRDGIGFRLYIDDINNFDTSEGYFYFGGEDGTPFHHDIEYRWYWSTFSGTLQSGWNRLFFRFKSADDVEYTEFDTTSTISFSMLRDEEAVMPLMPEYMLMKTIGFKIKGKGNPIKFYVDGFVIQRNYFNDYSMFSQGLYLTGRDYLTCPLGKFNFEAATIEFWLRPDYDFRAADIHDRVKTRSIFNFCNNANDVFGMAFTSRGLNIYYGNVTDGIEIMELEGITYAELDYLLHFAIVVSNNGRNIPGDNSTIRLYIENYLIASSYTQWDITEGKSFKFTLGGKPPLSIIENTRNYTVSSVDGVISDLKIYNYCKTDFTNSFAEIDDDELTDSLLKPSKFIEISKDNVTYYKVGDEELPLFFESIAAGSSVPVYIRSSVPSNLTGLEKRTSGLVVSWDVGV